MFASLEAWVLAKDWRTWISHVLIGFAIAAFDRLLGGAWPHALAVGAFFYYLREIGQIFAEAWADGSQRTARRSGEFWPAFAARTIRNGMGAVIRRGVDHLFDVAAPFVVLGLLASFVLTGGR